MYNKKREFLSLILVLAGTVVAVFAFVGVKSWVHRAADTQLSVVYSLHVDELPPRTDSVRLFVECLNSKGGVVPGFEWGVPQDEVGGPFSKSKKVVMSLVKEASEDTKSCRINAAAMEGARVIGWLVRLIPIRLENKEIELFPVKDGQISVTYVQGSQTLRTRSVGFLKNGPDVLDGVNWFVSF